MMRRKTIKEITQELTWIIQSWPTTTKDKNFEFLFSIANGGITMKKKKEEEKELFSEDNMNHTCYKLTIGSLIYESLTFTKKPKQTRLKPDEITNMAQTRANRAQPWSGCQMASSDQTLARSGRNVEWSMIQAYRITRVYDIDLRRFITRMLKRVYLQSMFLLLSSYSREIQGTILLQFSTLTCIFPNNSNIIKTPNNSKVSPHWGL